ncbi:hypothetical protein T4C_9395, partial [Trichinella pseudospiralis]
LRRISRGLYMEIEQASCNDSTRLTDIPCDIEE